MMDQSGEVNQDESGSEDSDLEIANKGLKFNEWEVKILEAVIFLLQEKSRRLERAAVVKI